METTATKRLFKRSTKRTIFFWAIAILPLLQFAIFYVFVNFNNIILAFQKYEKTPSLEIILNPNPTFENFAVALNMVLERNYLVTNSLIKFAVSLTIQYPLALIFSNYIYKKWPAAGFFKTVLFMPQLISGLIYGVLFFNLGDGVYPVIANISKRYGLFNVNTNLDTARLTVLFYVCLMGFGVNVLLFSGSMSGINESIVESAQLDGVNNIQEFIYITVPMIWPTIVQLFVVSVSAIFTEQMNLMTFYGDKAQELSTLGYFIYFQTQQSDIISPNPLTHLNYSQISALNLMVSAVVFPLTLGVRKLMTKFGPSVD